MSHKSRGGAGNASEFPELTQPINPSHQFPTEALVSWLHRNVDGFASADKLKAGTFVVRQFSHGQSNPTFYLQVGEGTQQRRYVLRKKPPGKLLPSAHLIEREFRVLSALRGSKVPVPRVYAFCSDNAVIGQAFYVMDYVEGRIFKDITLKKLAPSERFAIYSAMNETLANLHSLDISAIGLSDFGKAENYVQRQVERWTTQYEAAKVNDIPVVNELGELLRANIPNSADIRKASLIHGDFRLDNLIFHPREPRILAVLDWELSTIGHPTADLAYNCLPYYTPAAISSASTALPGLQGLDLLTLGIPSERDYLRAYIRRSGRVGYVQDFRFYVALSFFRITSIAQGVYKRSLQGNASNTSAKTFGDAVPFLAEHGLRVFKAQDQTSEEDDKAKKKADQVDRLRVDGSLAPFLPLFSSKFFEIRKRLLTFMEEYIYPYEAEHKRQFEALVQEKGSRWVVPPILEELKAKAKAAGLWNLFLAPHRAHPEKYDFVAPYCHGLSNLEYAPLCEIMGRVIQLAPEVFNCSAPDTGNMETLFLYGNEAQKKKWLIPLLQGEIRSAFAMTEPAVASSDATNIECRIDRVGDEYVINGRKWWTSGVLDPRCKVMILMGKTNVNPQTPLHKQQSMVLVPLDSPGVKVHRHLTVYGYDDAPHGHGEVEFQNVRVPASNILLGEGRGFEIAQGRLGPGRIHHVMRIIGIAERSLELLISRAQTRFAFKSSLSSKGTVMSDIAESRIDIEKCRLLTLQAASMMDSVGNKYAQQQIAMIKVAAPRMGLEVIDRALQVHGAMGVCQDTPLANYWAMVRTLRLADGPDEVHKDTIAKIELRKARL